MSRFVIVHGSVEAFEAACRDLGSGWAHHEVRDAGAAAEAVLAAVAGRSLVIHATAEEHLLDRLIDDLRRLGTVERWDPDARPAPPLGEDERSILELLAAGRTLREAAGELHLSLRTADRRLARARASLGVDTTAEAIVAMRVGRDWASLDGAG